MDCREARRLLSQGLTPGSSSPDRAALGFHLASCDACRAYRDSLQQLLLADLLSAQPGQPQRAVSAPRNAPARSPRSGPARRPLYSLLAHWFWYAGLGLLAAIALAAVIVVISTVASLIHTHQNVQAMIVPSAPPSGAALSSTAPAPTLAPTSAPLPATPTRPRPSATPLPTRTPLPTATATPAPPPAGGPITVLLLGSDRRPGESGPARTDAIIVARIDPERHRVALLSLPRDLWVTIPGYGHTRINAANVWGVTYAGPDAGIPLARDTVSNLLGIPIDYTIYIDFEGFIGAIDSLGGVTVDVQKELYDAQFPTMDYGYTEVHFLPGPQHMDGITALSYSRIRHSDSDFGRMRRQQAVLLGILARLHEQDLLASVKSIEDVTTALRDYVKTDIPEERLIGLVWALRSISPDQVELNVLDENMVTFGVGDDRYAEVVVPGAIDTLVRKLLDPTPR